MRVRTKILVGFLIITAITVPNGIIGYMKVEQGISEIENDALGQIEEIKSMSYLNNLIVNIMYCDEVLTNSARNYAFTGDTKWRELYFETELDLETKITDAINFEHGSERVFFEKIRDTNKNLVLLEHKSIQLVMEGRQNDAIEVLESEQYWKLKNDYKTALNDYATSKGLAPDRMFDISVGDLERSIRETRLVLDDGRHLLYFGVPAVFLIIALLCYLIFRSMTDPLNQLNKITEKIIRGEYDVQFPKHRNDEFGELAAKLQIMVQSFKKSLDTERELIKAQNKLKSEKLTAIGELAARVAHDLRNPLSVIKNTCDLMRIKYGNDEKILDYLEKMDNSIKRISHQVDDVLNFVRIAPLQKKMTSIKEMLVQTLNDIKTPSTITINLPHNDEKINCDEQKIKIVLSNILTNSIQAMESKGTITVTIKGYTKFVNIEISDSGPGIPDEILPKIFEPLFTTKQMGTGLGLSSCKNIVEQHGGTLQAKNNPTTFIITLPRI
jgi:signal transduction histidine kinase